MWKNKKHCWRYYHFTTCVPKTTIIWGKAHGIWSETDKICLSHFWPRQLKFGKILENTPRDIIFLHMFIINKNHMMYGYWDKRHNGQSILSFWATFCHLTFYGSSDIEYNRQNFLSFGTIFCLFSPLTTWKIKIWKQNKKRL